MLRVKQKSKCFILNKEKQFGTCVEQAEVTMKVFGILALCSLVYMVNGSCFASRKKGGHTECRYKNHVFPVGSEYTDMDDCYICTCSDTLMSCCGIGHKAGIARFPESCVMVKDGCNYEIVDANDPSRSCEYTKSVDTTIL